MKKKYHYIYKITLLCGSLEGYYYIGKHTTGDLGDGYAGSGTIIKKYFKKYHRRKNITYKKEILEYNESMEANAEREKEILGNLYETDPLCLNLQEGGGGGALCESSREKSAKGYFKKGNIPWNKGKHWWTDEFREYISKSFTGQPGHKHTEEAKAKIAKAKMIPIEGYELETGKYIGHWQSADEAEAELGINHSLISRVAAGTRRQTHGLIFKKVG